jgi:hypothetical protein
MGAMVRVVIQPSFGLPRFRRNWARTLDQSVPFRDEIVGPALTVAERVALDHLHPDGVAHFWGATAAHDKRMARIGTGDVVLLTGRKRVLAVGEVGLAFRNPAVARALWAPDPGTCPWDNVYSLLHLAHTEIPYEAVWALDGFRAGDNFMGLRLLDPAKGATVLAGLGITTATHGDGFAVAA